MVAPDNLSDSLHTAQCVVVQSTAEPTASVHTHSNGRVNTPGFGLTNRLHQDGVNTPIKSQNWIILESLR